MNDDTTITMNDETITITTATLPTLPTLHLSRPIKTADNKEIADLTLDFDALSSADLRQADRLRVQMTDAKAVDAGKMMSVLRLDASFQMAVGWLAACKGTAGLRANDFLSVALVDMLLLGEEASDYFFAP